MRLVEDTGEKFSIDLVTQNNGFMYADYFEVHSFYRITKGLLR